MWLRQELRVQTLATKIDEDPDGNSRPEMLSKRLQNVEMLMYCRYLL